MNQNSIEKLTTDFNSNRNVILDIMKGLAIIIVVANHANMPVMTWTSLIELSLFFMVAGYCYNPSRTNTADQARCLVLKRIKSLYLPCVLWSIACTLSNNILVHFGIIDNSIYSIKQTIIQLVKCLLFSGGGNCRVQFGS